MKPFVTSLLVMCNILTQLSHAGESGTNSSFSANEHLASLDKKDSIQVNLKLTAIKGECPPDISVPSCINCGGNDGTHKCLGLTEFADLCKGCECIPLSRLTCRYGIGPGWERAPWADLVRPRQSNEPRRIPSGAIEATTEVDGDGGSSAADTNSTSSSAAKDSTETASETITEAEVEDCPPEDRIPSCPNCGGDDGTRKCLGLKEFHDMWKGCDCIPTGRIDVYQVDLKKMDENVKILLSLPQRSDKRR